MEKEYVVYTSKLAPSKIKGELPDVITRYLSGDIHQVEFTRNLSQATRFYDPKEVFEVAEFLSMDVGEIELKVIKVKKKDVIIDKDNLH